MTQRATVERLVAPIAPNDKDDWGNSTPAASVWTVITAAVPVWCWPELEREVVGPDATKVVSSYRAILPKGTDVREADRLSNVVMRDGRSVVAGVLAIEAVVSHRDHVALSLRQIGGEGG